MKKRQKYKKMKLSKWQKKIILFFLESSVISLFILWFIMIDKLKSWPESLAVIIVLSTGLGMIIFATFVMGLCEKWEDTTVIINNFKHFHKYQFNYAHFQEFLADLTLNLNQNQYQLKKEYKENLSEEVYIYMKKKEKDLLDIWVIIYTDKYSKEVEKRFKDYLKDFSESIYDTKRTKDSLKSHVVLCVKEYTKYFENYVKKAYIEHSRDLIFPIGIEMTRKEIYIPSTKNVCITSTSDRKDYKMLKEEAMRMINIDEEN